MSGPVICQLVNNTIVKDVDGKEHIVLKGKFILCYEEDII